MHEYGIVQSMLKQLMPLVEAEADEYVRQISVAVGPLSGIEPLQLQEAFELLKPQFGLNDCELDLQVSTLKARCQACRRVVDLENFEFVCPLCGERELELLEGDRILVRSLTLSHREH